MDFGVDFELYFDVDFVVYLFYSFPHNKKKHVVFHKVYPGSNGHLLGPYGRQYSVARRKTVNLL